MKFFVPFADSPEQEETVYQVFIKNSGAQSHPERRVYSLTFMYHGKPCVVQVGEDITGFPEQIGPVLGIVETPNLVCIHTQLRGGLSATPVYVSTEDAHDLTFFDDWPARQA